MLFDTIVILSVTDLSHFGSRFQTRLHRFDFSTWLRDGDGLEWPEVKWIKRKPQWRKKHVLSHRPLPQAKPSCGEGFRIINRNVVISLQTSTHSE